MPINVTQSSIPAFEEYCEEIKDLWNSRWLTNMGTKHKAFKAQLEQYLEVPHVALYTNGHLALENVIAAMELPACGETEKSVGKKEGLKTAGALTYERSKRMYGNCNKNQ